MENVSLAIESARPHTIEGPGTRSLVQTYSVDNKGSHCRRVFSPCYRLLPGEGELKVDLESKLSYIGEIGV